MDPEVMHVLRQHVKEVADATERAYLELHRLGVPRPGALLLGPMFADQPAEDQRSPTASNSITNTTTATRKRSDFILHTPKRRTVA